MPRFNQGDRVRLIRDFDHLRAGQRGAIQQTNGSDGIAWVRFDGQPLWSIVHIDALEHMSVTHFLVGDQVRALVPVSQRGMLGTVEDVYEKDGVRVPLVHFPTLGGSFGVIPTDVELIHRDIRAWDIVRVVPKPSEVTWAEGLHPGDVGLVAEPPLAGLVVVDFERVGFERASLPICDLEIVTPRQAPKIVLPVPKSSWDVLMEES